MAELMYVIGSILILPAILFALVAQFKVSGSFEQYSKIPCSCGLTGAQIARKLLDQNGCSHVEVTHIGGHLSDHYDPRKQIVCLSDGVYNSTSLAAIGIAAHECGHAIQHKTKYLPLMLRQLVIKSTSLINKILLPLVIIGLIFSLLAAGSTVLGYPSEDFFFVLVIGFCAMYTISFIVNLITLPTEYDASHRAKKLLKKGNFIFDDEEYGAVSNVLSAAALTYLAGLIVSLAYMLRFVGLLMMMSGRRRR